MTLVRFKVGLDRIAMSKSEYYRRRKKNDPKLPKIVKPLGLGTKPSAFVDAELDAYERARIAERDNKTAA